MATNKIGVVLLVVGLISGVVSGYGIGFVTYQPQISQLESDVSTKDAQVSELESDLADAQNNVSSLETQLEEMQAELMPGRVPILHVGDYWIMELTYNTTTYTMTWNIIGEDANYYHMYVIYDPPYLSVFNATRWIDKSTLNPVRTEGHGNFIYDTTAIPYTYNGTHRLTYEGGVLFPLIVGKELNMTERMVYTYKTVDGMTMYTTNNSYTYKVTAIENVTVPAGTFTCFRITMYNATSGDLMLLLWYSDATKNYVKFVEYSTTPETTYELKEYSIRQL